MNSLKVKSILNWLGRAWLSILLTAVSCAVAPQALAANSCLHVFSEEISAVPRVFFKQINSKSLANPSAANEQTMENILKLSEALFAANAKALDKALSWQQVSVKDFVVESVKLIPGQYVDGYGVFIVKLKNDFNETYLRVRSNGVAAFIDKSFQYRQGPLEDPVINRFKATYLENGEIKTIDQGEVLISSLPDQIHLSRVMSPREREEWVDGKPITPGPFGDRSHFSINYFRFNKQEPYMVPFSRERLLAAYRRGDVEVNTYDIIDRMQMWHGKIKLEMEVVFMGTPAMESLRSVMQETLRQDILHYE